MRILLIDNYDSFTYNLYQLIAETYRQEPEVLRNDDPTCPALDLDGYDAVVISPGPGRPDVERDFGYSATALAQDRVPVLGVCLGLQGMGQAAGAKLIAAPRPRHGYVTRVRHTGSGLFTGLPQGFAAVRYHSLCLDEPLGAELEVLARAEDGVVMAIRHRQRPHWGVQFHPESIATEHGRQLLENFRTLIQPARTGGPLAAPTRTGITRPTGSCPTGIDPVMDRPAGDRPAASGARPRARVATLPRAVDTAAAFDRLHRHNPYAFWLDSARLVPGLSRFSFLGAVGGPYAEILSYRVGDRTVVVHHPDGSPAGHEPGDIFAVLERRLAAPAPEADLPFDFVGGYVGYLGYELKACTGGGPNRHRSAEPDALWLRADRFVAVDHEDDRTYLVAVGDEETAEADQRWLAETAAALAGLPGVGTGPAAARIGSPPAVDPEPWLVRSRLGYLADIAACQRELTAGESYEICLTNQVRVAAPADDLAFYRRLRQVNPAPYGALLRLGGLTVYSSSPECFLRVGVDGTVESKPIKGTAPRDADPERDERLRRALVEDAKTRAENLMIVDLLRNDLGRVCRIGSVTVPRFLAIESYATMHQLVSTVRGRLRPGVSAPACARSCFPGGSMTGAPKLRTMEILDRLETGARGIYSGALGWFSRTGAADLSIVIRTAVRSGDQLSIGAGGAIVLDSEPEAEYAEMLLKAAAPLRALPG